MISADNFSGKIIYVISLVNNSLALMWYFTALHSTSVKFSVVFLHPEQPKLMMDLSIAGIKTSWIRYSGKKELISATFKLWKLFIKEHPEVVHTHLFDASAAGLIAANLSGVPVKVHTRHHATQHHVYHPHAVKYDRIINWLSDRIIAISENIRSILIERENVAPEKIDVIHHGFDIGYFKSVSPERRHAVRLKYNIQEDKVVIGMISRFTVWKGIQYVIPAFANVLKEYPNAILVLANASGDYETELNEVLQILPRDSYRLISFENDSPALYSVFNIFVHVPVDEHSEAFGQVYVEAFAAGLPCIFTLSGIASEFVKDHNNALVVPYKDSGSIELAIFELISNPKLVHRLSSQASADAQKFDIRMMVKRTLDCYGG